MAVDYIFKAVNTKAKRSLDLKLSMFVAVYVGCVGESVMCVPIDSLRPVHDGGGGGGGGGFLLACEDLGRMFDHSFPVCAFFFFFLKWRLARAH